MCGIVGYIGRRNVSNVIMVGLERLEYRGYDSCGIATVSKTRDNGRIRIRKMGDQVKVHVDPFRNPGGTDHLHFLAGQKGFLCGILTFISGGHPGGESGQRHEKSNHQAPYDARGKTASGGSVPRWIQNEHQPVLETAALGDCRGLP